MKIKVNEATSLQLNWLVAKCLGKKVSIRDGYVGSMNQRHDYDPGTFDWYQPTSNWAQGGPIIEREKINIVWGAFDEWSATKNDRTEERLEDSFKFRQNGPTSLIAAMRCFVASKLGDEVEVPDELVPNKSHRNTRKD